MKTSRQEGILIIQTKKPYKIAISGQQDDRTEIICKEVNSKCEGAAMDLEQLLTTALGSVENKGSKATKKQMEKDEKKDKDFFGSECPSDADIEEQANNLHLAVKMQRVVKISELMEVFGDFLATGRVCAVGDQKMTQVIWDTVSAQDKIRILFWYAAFFVNPLESLANMASSMDIQG